MELVDEQEGRDASAMAVDDPWYDETASGRGEEAGRAPGDGRPDAVPRQRVHSTAEIYLEVQRSPAFQEVRGRYRRFVFPATLAFLLWYLAYVVAATAAPGLMAQPVAGAVNVAMVAGLGQFLTTFLLTWAYARHARLRRDRAALELRWDTQEMTRGVVQP
ncbi:membrane protein [Streptomyces tanashiensis]|nr:membrane protein [Streptomyces tanashiensis]